jgi:hypothetical protein
LVLFAPKIIDDVKTFRQDARAMDKITGVAAVIGCLLLTMCAGAQAGDKARKIVLPSPQLIYCRSAQCSQLWKPESNGGSTVYPSQVLTDLVDGEIVGLTAVYGKSVSTEELQAAINKQYAKWTIISGSVWRVEPEKLAISIADGEEGAKEVIYLKFGTYSSHAPAAHIDCGKCKK